MLLLTDHDIIHAPAGPRRGSGYISSRLPDGLLTVDGVPSPRNIVCIHRKSCQFVMWTRSAGDGTYRFDGLDPAQEYDIIARDGLREWGDYIAYAIRPGTRPVVLAELPPATTGRHYQQQLRIGYGTPPFTVTATGALPAGLEITAGIIHGAAHAGQASNWPLAVTVLDADERTDTATVILRVFDPPS